MSKENNIAPYLYTDHKTKSKVAIDLLHENDIQFVELRSSRNFSPEPGFNPPVLQSREGDFRGLGGVKTYISIVKNDP